MSMFYKDKGNWVCGKIPRNSNPIYIESLTVYLNCLDPLFSKAKQASNFEFILTLLDISGTKDCGWDASETTQEIFKTFNSLKKRIKYSDEQTYVFLLLYGLIVEASFIYDLLSNLLNVVGGGRYNRDNFPSKKRGGNLVPQSPSEKIRKLLKQSSALKIPKALKELDDIYDRELRNAVFHSNYSLYDEEIRLLEANKRYSTTEIHALINKTLAYYEAIVFLRKYYRNSYTKPEVIDVHPDFSPDTREKAIVMVREGAGVIGIKDIWTKQQIDQGKIPFSLLKLLPYEMKMFSDDPFRTEFPVNKIDKTNKLLKRTPIFLRKRLIKIIEREYINK